MPLCVNTYAVYQDFLPFNTKYSSFEFPTNAEFTNPVINIYVNFVISRQFIIYHSLLHQSLLPTQDPLKQHTKSVRRKCGEIKQKQKVIKIQMNSHDSTQFYVTHTRPPRDYRILYDKNMTVSKPTSLH